MGFRLGQTLFLPFVCCETSGKFLNLNFTFFKCTVGIITISSVELKRCLESLSFHKMVTFVNPRNQTILLVSNACFELSKETMIGLSSSGTIFFITNK